MILEKPRDRSLPADVVPPHSFFFCLRKASQFHSESQDLFIQLSFSKLCWWLSTFDTFPFERDELMIINARFRSPRERRVQVRDWSESVENRFSGKRSSTAMAVFTVFRESVVNWRNQPFPRDSLYRTISCLMIARRRPLRRRKAHD